ncbi:unnamed protein product [Heterobilharzia americana]|nr:unnamed protein product [Heterobilharzia americana]
MVGNGIAETTDDTFIKWLNDHLAKATPPLLIYDLTEDNVCNGVAIGLLLEIIGGIKIDGLLVLRRLNVKLNNIQPEDVMGGDKETVLQLLVAINDHFIPTVKGRKFFSSHDADYKIDTSGRTSAWSAVSGSTRRTPISQSQSINMNGSHENGGFHHSHKNLHLTNGRDTPHTDLPWSNSSDHFIDSQQPYSYQPLAATPTPSEISGCTSPRSKSTVYRARSDPLSPRYSHGKREIFASTTPINIKSALPNLSSGSRGYYPPSTPSIPRSTAPSYQHDKNAYGLQSGRSTAEVPQLFDSMNEIQHLKSQLNMLSKLVSICLLLSLLL